MKRSIIFAYIAIALIAAAAAVFLIVYINGLTRPSEYIFDSSGTAVVPVTTPAPPERTAENSAPAESGEYADTSEAPSSADTSEAPPPAVSSPPVTAEEVEAHNRTALDNPMTVPEDAVRLYISADGDEDRIRDTLAEIRQISDRICEGIESDYDKLFAISQWVSKNFYYDYDARDSSVTAETIALYGVLETRRTVCMGFANLFAALCSAQGIDCRVAHGAAVPGGGTFELSNGEGSLHEWNIAVIDGREVWVDTLWNTTNSYRSGIYSEGDLETAYFDTDGTVLAKNHRADRIEIRDYFSALD